MGRRPLPSPTTPLEPAAALALLAGGRDPETVGPLAGLPMLAVDLTRGDAAADTAALAAVARRLPCVVVGVTSARGDEAVPLDILLTIAPDPPRPWVHAPNGLEEGLETLAGAVERSPIASVALVQLLRMSEPLEVRDALVAESLTYSTLQAGPEFSRWLRETERPAPDDADEPAVLVERTAGAMILTLNRPRRRNAYSARMRDDLVAALELASFDPSIDQIHLRGAGPSFCSGGDLAEFGTAPDPATAHLVRTTRSAAARLHECAPRVTAHLHGACVGAGIELAAFAGRVVARPDAYVVLPEVQMGLVPGAGGTVSITRRAGRQRTAFLALTGRPADARTALRWGLVDALEEAPGRARDDHLPA